MAKGRLGIIGGMGAAAGVRMAHDLVVLAQRYGAVNDEDYPDFILHNLPFHGLNFTGVEYPYVVKNQLEYALRLMSTLECQYAIVACNSVHGILPDVAKEFTGTILSLVECAMAETTGPNTGVICSRTTKSSGLYSACKIQTTDEEQDDLDRAIAIAMAGKQNRNTYAIVEGTIQDMINRGAEQVIVGCTELPMCIRPEFSYPVIDAGLAALRRALSLLK